MFNQIEIKNRIKWMAIEATFVLSLFLVLKLYWIALGIVIGTVAGIFNLWLVTNNTIINKKGDGDLRNPLGGYLIRLLVGALVLTSTGLINPYLLLGALFGLTLEMQTYLWTAGKLVFKNRNK